MKFLVLLVACLVVSAVSLPTTNRQRRDILPGDFRYGTDYHLHHHHHDNQPHNVQVVKSIGDFAGSYNSPSPVYGPPGYQPGTPVNSVEPTFELPTIQVNQVKPAIPSTNYGVPVQQNQNDHHEHHYEQHQQHQEHHEHHEQQQQQQQYQQQHFQQYHFEHHYQQPQQHIQFEQQRQELHYTPQVSYGVPSTIRAAPVPIKAPVTSYGTPVESHVQNTHVPVVHARAPLPQDYSIQIYKSQPVKINFQPHSVYSHPQPTNNGYYYHPQPTQETSNTYLAPVEKKPTVNYQPQPSQPTNNGYNYHPQPVPQPSPRPTPQPSQPTNNDYHYPQPTQNPTNKYLTPVEKKPSVNYQSQPAPQPTNTYLTPVIEEKEAPVHNDHPQPTNQYLTPVEKKPEVPEAKAVSSYAVHETESEEKPTGHQLPNFPQFEFPELPQFQVPELPSFQPSSIPELPQFPTSSFQQFDPSQILSDTVSSFSGYVNQKPTQPEATTEKERTVEHNEPTQQVEDNGSYIY